MNIFSGFVSDIAAKLMIYLSEGEQNGETTRSYAVQMILAQLADQLTQYEFYDALPLIANGLHDLRISLGV